MKHIVLFQLIETLADEERQRIMQAFKTAIEQLPASIPVIQHIEVGFNTSPAESWDMALVAEFASLDDIHFYATHPAHIAAASIIKGKVKGRSCVDF